jgi:diguanylate cyclase (GGDEF)-like protein
MAVKWMPFRLSRVSVRPLSQRPAAYRVVFWASLVVMAASVAYAASDPSLWVPSRDRIVPVLLLAALCVVAEWTNVEIPVRVFPGAIVAAGGGVPHILIVMYAPPALAGAVIGVATFARMTTVSGRLYVGLLNMSMDIPGALAARAAADLVGSLIPGFRVPAALTVWIVNRGINTLHISLVRYANGYSGFARTIREMAEMWLCSLEPALAPFLAALVLESPAGAPFCAATLLATGVVVAAAAYASSHYRGIRTGSLCPLTGAFTHALFQDTLRLRLRGGTGVGLVMLDIDHFKKLNDTRGHLEGDRVLREVAGVVMRTVSRSDFVARYGGEEFAVITSASSADVARSVAERVREAVERTGVTVSVGVAFGEPGADPGELIEAADAALYRAKRAGRNRVEVCADPVGPHGAARGTEKEVLSSW